MNAKKLCTRAFTMLLVMLMVIGMIPMSVLAVSVDSTLSASLDEAKSFIDGITVNNSSNDPSTVVSTFKTHFTWDNEKRENGKDYLFDWSYYNGVVFEGIEYLYEVTGDEKYKDYVVEYMSSLIKADGTWAYCTNSGYTSKQCAGYNSTHGADCYKTASLLLDAYEMTGDQRYLTMAATLYTDLDSAAANSKYNLKNAGNNYRHTWASDPSPDLWLDGLYMILPFRAEYAKYIGDTEELDLIVDRLQWVSDNMYNEENGLFYHAADSATSNSGTHWLRSIGWYAAAIVDVMDSMDGENLEAMQAQLVKLVDGMIACQNTSNGMWLNNMDASKSSSNPYETSGTALVCYAIMKAVNNGWLDDSYAKNAVLAFNGICNEKLSGSTLTDICYIGNPGSTNSTFKDNEGKGVGPFIMFYAETLEYYNAVRRVVYTDDIIQITATGLGLTAIEAEDVYAEVESKIADVIDTEKYYIAYDVELSAFDNFNTVTYTMEIADGMPTTDLVIYHLADDGTLTPVNALMTAETEDYLAYLTFTTNTDGIFVYGTKKVVVDEDAKLESLDITSQPEVNAYFKTEEDDEPALDITGLVVTATFSDGQTKTIEWNEFDETLDGYSLTFDMTKVGEQDVTVSYTYEGVTKTATFKITVFDTEIADEASGVVIAPSVPGVTEVTVEDNSDNETVKAALKDVVTTFVSYDISLKGYTQGDKVVVTLPIPEGTVNPVVYYVPESGEAVKLDAYIYDDVVVFVTDHFSTYAVGSSRASTGTNTGTGAIVGETTYTLDTNGVTANKNYLIVNTNSGTGYALTNNGSNTPGSTAVTISGSGTNKTITVDDDTDIAWVFEDNESGTISNNGRFVYPNYGSLSLNTNGSDLTIDSQGNGAYRIYRYANRYYYYVTYSSSNWTGAITQRANSVGNVYLYEYTSTTPGSDVTFTVNQPAAMAPGDTVTLTGTVTVDGTTYNLSGLDEGDISWEASGTFADVENGVVTGIKDGSETITITLHSVNGKAVVGADGDSGIIVEVTANVASKSITSAKLSGNSMITVNLDEHPDYSKIKLEVTYDNGDTATITEDNGLVFTTVDTSVKGKTDVKISYLGVEYGTVTVNVVVDLTKLPDATVYPEYPKDGAVRIDKTATPSANFSSTGVARVEMAVAGVSQKESVDAVLVIDISNSMSWGIGTKDYNANNKLDDVMASVVEFARILLADNEDGTPTNNTITIVTFAGYDKDNWAVSANFIDSVRTLVTATSSIEVIEKIAGKTEFTDADTITIGYIPEDENQNDVDNVTTESGDNRGDTNYDYAFWQTYQAIKEAGLDTNGNSTYVLFMTDGCASTFNNTLYRSKGATDMYIPGTKTTYGNQTPANGTAWVNWIKQSIAENGGNIYAKQVYEIVDGMYGVGFDMAYGSFSGITTWDSSVDWAKEFNDIVSKVAGTNSEGVGNVMTTAAENVDQLKEFYTAMATEIRNAGREASAHDVIGSNFNLQMANTVVAENGVLNTATPPTISVIAYDLDANGERTGTKTDIEVVTFNAEGTEAYSSLKGEGVNIMSTDSEGVVTISANYFTYKKTNVEESFDWYIGDITEKEITLAFDVSLTDAAVGQRETGLYYTNDEAYIDYIDVYGKHANRDFPSPAVAWGGVAVGYEFYLVNEDGKPVTRDMATIIPVANRVTVLGPEYISYNQNEDGSIVAEILAKDVLPNGYVLYDETAKYQVIFEVKTVDGVDQLIPTSVVTGNATIELTTPNVDQRTAYVIFPVTTYPEIEDFSFKPDSLVIDYGKSIVFDVLENDTATATDYTKSVVGFTVFSTTQDQKAFIKTFDEFGTTDEFITNNGFYKINTDGDVVFTPSKMLSTVDRVFAVIKLVKDNDVIYMFNEVNIIPATIMYYETNFATGVFTNTGTWANAKDADVEDITTTSEADFTQSWQRSVKTFTVTISLTTPTLDFPTVLQCLL